MAAAVTTTANCFISNRPRKYPQSFEGREEPPQNHIKGLDLGNSCSRSKVDAGDVRRRIRRALIVVVNGWDK